MAKDRTIATRTHRQRVKRKAAGWHEVKVWVPKREQADAIRNYASDCRTEQPNPKLELTEQQVSANHIGFKATMELTDKIYNEIKEQHPSLHRDACYRVVEEVLDNLRVPPPKDDVTICLIDDGDECHRFVGSKHILERKLIKWNNMVFEGSYHVMDDIWNYYRQEHYFLS